MGFGFFFGFVGVVTGLAELSLTGSLSYSSFGAASPAGRDYLLLVSDCLSSSREAYSPASFSEF